MKKKSENSQTVGASKKSTPKEEVSLAVIHRLPRYYRYLSELLREGKMRISSSELARLMDVTASQIRQDLNCFGGFGQQGYGYNVKYLHDKIGELLGMNCGFTAVIVGAGHLGSALASSHIFIHRGVTTLAFFDNDPNLIGKSIAGLPIYDVRDLPEYCREHPVDIGVLTTPKEAAESVLRLLAESGVRGVWNFSNMELASSSQNSVIVQNTHIGDSLMNLCYNIKTEKDASSGGRSNEV